MERTSYAVATVAEWNDEEGWGVLETEDFPIGIWVHFSAIDVEGYKTLRPGERVEVDVEGPLPFDQDGYRHRARHLYPLGASTRKAAADADPASNVPRTNEDGVREE